MNFAHARDIMVESQVRTSDVTDPQVLGALRSLARERFAPAHRRAVAYADAELEVAPSRFLMRPRDLAKLVQALAPRSGERALEITGATGYGAAVLARCCAHVVTLDPDPELCFAARAALEGVGIGNCKAVSAPAIEGWPDDGPYDVILLNGSAELVPESWLDQLRPGGRLGAIVRDGAVGHARIYTRSADSVAFRAAFDAAPPVSPGLARPASFVF